jgi:hypothetical protein
MHSTCRKSHETTFGIRHSRIYIDVRNCWVNAGDDADGVVPSAE